MAQSPKTKEWKYFGTDYDFTPECNWFYAGLPQWKSLKSQYGKGPINVLEVGLFEGRSTVWILENLFDNGESRFIGIDTFEGSRTLGLFHPSVSNLEGRFRRNVEKTGKASQVTVMKGKSFEQLGKLNQENKTKFDFIYIDGSHNAEDVLADTVLAWPLLKENGIMILDDLGYDRYLEPYNNPRIAIESFVACHSFEIEVLEQNYQLEIRKVVKNGGRRFTVVNPYPYEDMIAHYTI